MFIYPSVKYSLGTADKEVSQTQPQLSRNSESSRGDRLKNQWLWAQQRFTQVQWKVSGEVAHATECEAVRKSTKDMVILELHGDD